MTRFTSDTSSYIKGINEMQAKLRSLNKDMKDNQAEQKAAAKTIKDAEKEISKLTTQIAKHGDEDGKLAKRIEELNRTIVSEKDHIEKLKVAQSQMQREINETNGKIEAQKKALDTLQKSYDQSVESVKKLAAEIGGLAAAGTAALAALFKFSADAAVWADDLETMSQKTGIAASELQKFQYASEIIDVSADTISSSLNRMTLNMQSAQKSAGTQRAAFEELGVSFEDSTGKLRDRETVFYELIDALGKINSETERDALAMNIFGRSATELNPLIKGGAQQLKELGAQAEAAGLILSDDAVKGLHSFNDQIDLLKAKGGQISKILAGQTTPAFEGMLKVADDLLDKVNELAQTGQLEQIAKKAGIYITDAAGKLEKLISFVWKYKEAIAAGAAAMVAFKIGMDIGSLVTSLFAGFEALSVATKAETADMTALNVVMDANPIGAVIGLVGALTGALVTLSVTMNLGTDGFDKINESTENYLKTLRDAEKTAADNESQTLAQARTVESLAAEYEDLRTKTSRNASEQKALDNVANELAKTLGTTVDKLKDQSGSYRELTGDIEQYLEKLREQVSFENNKNALTAAYTSLDNATEKYKTAKEQLDELKAANADFEEKLKDYNYAVSNGRDPGFTQQEIEELTNYENQLKGLKKTVGEYSWQMTQAASSVLKYEKALGSTVDEEKRWDELLGEMYDDGAAVSDMMDSASNNASDLSGSLSTLGTASDGVSESASELIGKIDTILGDLDSVQTEVQNTGRLSISTIKNLLSKYPELEDDINGYISGVRSAGDVIKGLQDIYDKDVKKYSEVVAAKLQSEEDFKKAVNEAGTDFINVYKDVYGVDLRNFANANEAKEAILDNLHQKMKRLLDEYRTVTETYSVGVENGKYVYYKNGVRAEDQEEAKKAINDAYKSYSSAYDEYSNLQNSNFAQTLAAQIINKFGSSSYASTSGSSGSSKSSSSKWRVWNGTAEVTGETYAQAYLDWMSKIKALGKMSTESEIKRLENLKKRSDLTADDRYKIELNLYNAKKKLAEDEQKELQNRANLAQEAYKKLINDQIELQNKKAQAAKEAADKEIAAIDALMKKRQEEAEDDKLKKELQNINDQLRYKNLDALSRYELQKRRQEILTEKSEIEYERKMNARKDEIRANSERLQEKTSVAIERLNKAADSAAYAFARQSGTLSNSQIVNNNSTQQNITLVQNSLSDKQMLEKLKRELTSL